MERAGDRNRVAKRKKRRRSLELVAEGRERRSRWCAVQARTQIYIARPLRGPQSCMLIIIRSSVVVRRGAGRFGWLAGWAGLGWTGLLWREPGTRNPRTLSGSQCCAAASSDWPAVGWAQSLDVLALPSDPLAVVLVHSSGDGLKIPRLEDAVKAPHGRVAECCRPGKGTLALLALPRVREPTTPPNLQPSQETKDAVILGVRQR